MPRFARHKYKAKKVELDGIRFDSKLEARCYEQLKLFVQAGVCAFFLRQVPVHLPAGVTLRIDFLVFWSNGTAEFIDAKGMETDTFRLKRRQVEHLYPFKIQLWKKAPSLYEIRDHLNLPQA